MKILFLLFLLSFFSFSQTSDPDPLNIEQQINNPSPVTAQEMAAAQEFQEMLKQLYNEDGTLKADAHKTLMQGAYMEKMIKLNQSVLKNRPNDQLKDLIKAKLGDRSPLVDEYPGLFNFVVELLKDESLLVDFVRGIKTYSKFRNYALFLVLLFIIRFFVNRKLRQKQVNIVFRFLRWCGINLIFIALNFCGLYFFYQKELDPIIDLANKHF